MAMLWAVDDDTSIEGSIEPLRKLDKDLKQAAKSLKPTEVRWLVGRYYSMQEDRIRAAAQQRKHKEHGEPNQLVSWMAGNYAALERDIIRAMDSYTDGRPEGRWMKSITGIGPVLAAGLLAHIDIAKAPSPSHIWSFAGVNPMVRWVGSAEAERIVRATVGGKTSLILDDVLQIAAATGRSPTALWNLVRAHARGWKDTSAPLPESVTSVQMVAALAKRPWNADLKVLVWKVGQSFVKSSNNPASFYGPLYKQRKAYELTNNNMRAEVDVPGEPDAKPVTRYVLLDPRGHSQYADQAAHALERKRYGIDTAARKWYEQGMLSPAHIQQRVERWTAKLFLSHLWYVMYETAYGTVPPRPYVIEHLGHVDFIPAPNWPLAA